MVELNTTNKINKNKKYGFSLVELVFAMIIVGIISGVMVSITKPSEAKKEALFKAGRATFIQIEFATKNILARYTSNYTLTRMRDDTGLFSIEKDTSLNRMIALYRKVLVGVRSSALKAEYSDAILTNGTDLYNDLKPSNFTGFKMRNGAYFGLKLHGNCSTDINYIYDPSTPQTRTKTKTCGIIFFDVNSEKQPNYLGIDQYIIALGKKGVK